MSTNQSSNCPLAFNNGTLFSSPAPELVFAVFFGFINIGAPVVPVSVCAHCSASVACSTLPATVSLAFGVGVLVHATSRCTVVAL